MWIAARAIRRMNAPVVLVHGGGFDARCWDLVVPMLGDDVLAVDLPGRGRHPADLATVTLGDFARSIVADIDDAGFDEVVLVGHSLAGCSLPGAIGLLPGRVRHAVFLAATVPSDGASALDMLDPAIREMVEAGMASGEAGGTMDPEIARLVFGNDMVEAQFDLMVERLVPEATAVVAEPVDLAPLRNRTFGCTWLRPTLDAIVAPDDQLRFAGHVGDCRVVDLDAAHVCMISRPEATAAAIRAIVDDTG